jgi:hypothetical protein
LIRRRGFWQATPASMDPGGTCVPRPLGARHGVQDPGPGRGETAQSAILPGTSRSRFCGKDGRREKKPSTRLSQEPCLGVKVKFEAVGRLLRDPGSGLFGDVRGMIVGRRQAKLARSVGESPTQVKPSRRPGSACCVSRRQRRPRSVHSGCVGCVIESRNIFTAGAETVDKVERNMAMAAMRGHSHPAGV